MNYVVSPILPVVQALAYFLPFALVLGSSFLLMRGFAMLEQRNKALSEVVERDHLTRLANRAAFYRRGKEMTIQANIHKSGLSLIMFDADYFKSINDTFGHIVGDLALQHLAEILRQVTRDNDLVARWGGEEFAILLRSSGALGARAFAERACETVAETPFYWEGNKINMTMSAGVTEWNHTEDKFESLVLRADKALYVAKSAGRDRVHVSFSYPDQVEGYEQDVQFDEAVA
ncbi:GGDEF domain-containing protein [Cohaesibacter celericrescens]|uniref:GGDEF domain-containing protein n=1 Tax=Cohaesibacter celericrescens TaxID=2067669 RepID=UPI0035645D7D